MLCQRSLEAVARCNTLVSRPLCKKEAAQPDPRASQAAGRSAEAARGVVPAACRRHPPYPGTGSSPCPSPA